MSLCDSTGLLPLPPHGGEEIARSYPYANIFRGRQPTGTLHPSAASVSDLDLCTFHDDRHLPGSLGKLQHLLKPRRVLVDIIINRVFIG